MNETCSVVVLSAVVPVLFFQILGVVSPFWVCTFDGNQTQPCSPKGLYYTCNDKGCKFEIFINMYMFGVCLGSFIVTLGSSVVIFKVTYDQLSLRGSFELSWNKHILLFTLGQVGAVISQIHLLTTYDVVGWSCIVFTSFSWPFAFSFICSSMYFIYLFTASCK